MANVVLSTAFQGLSDNRLKLLNLQASEMIP